MHIVYTIELYLKNCNLEEASLLVIGYFVSSQKSLFLLDMTGNTGILQNDTVLINFGKHILNNTSLGDIRLKGGFDYDFMKRSFPWLFGQSIASTIEKCVQDWSRKKSFCLSLKSLLTHVSKTGL